MKSIGIITFHSVENYGAFLQTYASSQILKKINPKLDVTVVNYRPLQFKHQDQINLLAWTTPENNLSQNLKAICLYLLTVPDRIQKKIRFFIAKRLIPVRGNVFTQQESYDGERFDYLYLGSDQIWNPEITGGIDPVYFGNLRGCNNSIKFSYAASFGGADYSDVDKQVLSNYLNELRYIGVREKSSENFVTDLIGKQPYTVIDPVLLLCPSKWYTLTKKRLYKHPYILAYQLRENSFLLKQAYDFAHLHGCTLLHFGDRGLREFRKEGIKSVSFSGPFEFINYIRYADAVFTDSFHATCFSFIFERPLFTYLGQSRSNRIVDLGDSLGFSSFIVPCGESAELDSIKSIPSSARVELSKRIKDSYIFLYKILGEI